MIRSVAIALSLLVCLAVNAQAQFTFSPDTIDFGRIVRGQDRFAIDTVTNASSSFVWIGSLHDLGPSKRIHIPHPPTQPVGLAPGRSYIFTIEYYADDTSTEVDTIVVSQYQNGDGQRLILHGSAHDSLASGVSATVLGSTFLRIDSQPVHGDLRATIVMPQSESVTLTIRDLLGRQVLSEQAYLAAGTHDHLFATSKLAAADYILELLTAKSRLTQKFVLIR